MSEESAGGVQFAEFAGPNGQAHLAGCAHRPVPPRGRRGLIFRGWVSLRKLVRARQESSALKLAKATFEAVAREIESESAREIEAASQKAAESFAAAQRVVQEQEQALSELRQKMERQQRDASERIQRLEADVQSYEKSQLPALRNDLKVKSLYIQELEGLLENRRLTTETMNAILNQKLVDAEEPPNQSQAEAYRQLLRGE